MEKSDNSSPQKKETETNVVSTGIMDPKPVPESPIDVHPPIIEHTIPQEESVGSDKIKSGENVLEAPVGENVIIEKESQKHFTFSDTKFDPELKMATETNSNQICDKTIVEDKVIIKEKLEVPSDSQAEVNVGEVKSSDEDASVLTIEDNLKIDEDRKTLDDKTVLHTPASQQIDSDTVSRGDSNRDDDLRAATCLDMTLADQKILYSSGDTRDKVDLSCEKPELKQEECIVQQLPSISTTSQGQTTTYEVMGTSVESEVSATKQSDVSEPEIPQSEIVPTEQRGNETVSAKVADIQEEVLTPTGRQIQSANEASDDPDATIKNEVLPDIDPSDQSTSQSTSDSNDKDSLSDSTLVSDSEPYVEEHLYLASPPLKEYTGEFPDLREAILFPQRVTAAIQGTYVKPYIKATPGFNVGTSTEPEEPVTPEYLDQSLLSQKLGTPMKPSKDISSARPDIPLSGTSREIKPRHSFLRTFDPLVCESPDTRPQSVFPDVPDIHQALADLAEQQPGRDSGILIDFSGIVLPGQEHTQHVFEDYEEPNITNGVTKFDQDVVPPTESVGTQTCSEDNEQGYSDSRESLRVHCNDSSQSFNEDFFEAQSVITRHLERSLKGFADFGPKEEDIEGRVFEIEPQVYEDESELSKTPVREKSPLPRKTHKHESSGEETHEEQPTQPPKYLHVLEKQRRNSEEIQIITSDSETDIEIKKKKVLGTDDIKTPKVCEKVKYDEPKKKKTPEKVHVIVAPFDVSITGEQGDKNTKKVDKDNKLPESEKSSSKETSESDHGKVRAIKKLVKKKGDLRAEIDTNKEEEKLSEPQEEESALEEKYLRPFIQKLAVTGPFTKMADLSEKINEQQQEISELKLQLNASQQAKASLELEIRQKEEVIIKTQAEALKKEQAYKHELKELTEKLKERSKLIEHDSTKELEEELRAVKAREQKIAAELSEKHDYHKMMDEYETALKMKCSEIQKLSEELNSVKTHLSNLELAFSDVHLKYEKTKESLQVAKNNETSLSYQLGVMQQTNIQQEEKYESLMLHAKSQIERSNRENLATTESYEGEITKLKAIIKRLEIKCSSLESTLQQKVAECEALASLCDEVTGKKV